VPKCLGMTLLYICEYIILLLFFLLNETKTIFFNPKFILMFEMFKLIGDLFVSSGSVIYLCLCVCVCVCLCKYILTTVHNLPTANLEKFAKTFELKTFF